MPGKRQAQGTGRPPESSSCGAAAAAFGSRSITASSASDAPGRSSESSFSSRQYFPRAVRIRVESFSALPVRRSSAIRRTPLPSARTASAEPSSEALSRTRISRSISAGWVRSIAARQASRYSRPFVFTTQ
jgi:hypothetical protein